MNERTVVSSDNRQLKIRYKQLGTMIEVCKNLICL